MAMARGLYCDRCEDRFSRRSGDAAQRWVAHAVAARGARQPHSFARHRTPGVVAPAPQLSVRLRRADYFEHTSVVESSRAEPRFAIDAEAGRRGPTHGATRRRSTAYNANKLWRAWLLAG